MRASYLDIGMGNNPSNGVDGFQPHDNKSTSEIELLMFKIFSPFMKKFHALQKISKLETDNSVSNPYGNGIPNGLETEFSVFKTLVSNCVRLNPSLIRDGNIPSLFRLKIETDFIPSLIRDGYIPSLIRDGFHSVSDFFPSLI